MKNKNTEEMIQIIISNTALLNDDQLEEYLSLIDKYSINLELIEQEEERFKKMYESILGYFE